MYRIYWGILLYLAIKIILFDFSSAIPHFDFVIGTSSYYYFLLDSDCFDEVRVDALQFLLALQRYQVPNANTLIVRHRNQMLVRRVEAQISDPVIVSDK